MSASESEITFLVLQHQLHLSNSKSFSINLRAISASMSQCQISARPYPRALVLNVYVATNKRFRGQQRAAVTRQRGVVVCDRCFRSRALLSLLGSTCKLRENVNIEKMYKKLENDAQNMDKKRRIEFEN